MAQFFKNLNRYWVFQVAGWGLFILINNFFAITYDQQTEVFVYRLLVFVTLGVLFTHLMRFCILKLNLLSKSLEAQIFGLIGLDILFSFLIGVIEVPLTELLDIRTEVEQGLKEGMLIISHTFYAFIYVFIWSVIYFIFHYVNKTRAQQLDTLKLETLVKELELKTIKSHINPHFIFNALNSIRALIDENPERARQAVTALSNILRSSMQAENIERVPLYRELNIVKDYLDLEHIRFEDRLHVRYDIDAQTTNLPVPYMMLQTLVENAIKHGISKHIAGGKVDIRSEIKANDLLLIVRNTGQLNGAISNEGFGIKSTASRLLLMFGNEASFTIQNYDTHTVEAKVTIPILNEY